MKIENVPISKLGMTHIMGAYEEFLGAARYDDLRLLELGIAEGDSLRRWAEWLPNAKIVGLDIKPKIPGLDTDRIKTYQGEQQDRGLLDRIAAEQAPGGFDIIIDDASHVGQLTRISFWHLFVNHLKPGGLYFIEDWGTGYWPAYVDGRRYRPAEPEFAKHEKVLKQLSEQSIVHRNVLLRKAVGWTRWNFVKKRFDSHQYGMVGFIKELVDECGMADITHPHFGSGEQKQSRFDWLRLSLGHAIIKKPPRTGNL